MALDLAPALELRRREPGELFPRELSCGVNKATYEKAGFVRANGPAKNCPSTYRRNSRSYPSSLGYPA